jgi:predicted dehydrogenase
MLRIGIVGFGKIAENGHLPAWQSFPEVQVTAIADLSAARLQQASKLLPDASLFDTPLALIKEGEVDCVDICTPPTIHLELILAACQRRIPNIVSEKPLVLSIEDYLQVAQAKQNSGSRIVSVNNWVHSDLNTLVLSALKEGAIGEVRKVELRTGRPDSALGDEGWLPRWRTDAAHSGGGVILDHGWHQLYLILGWVGQPLERVRAAMRTVDERHLPVEDEAEIDLEFSDVQARIELAWTATNRTNGGLITGSDGVVEIHDDRIVIRNKSGGQERVFCGKLTESSYHPDWFRAIFERNIVGVNKDEADRNFGETGVLVSAIRAVYDSAAKDGLSIRPTFPTSDSIPALIERAEV